MILGEIVFWLKIGP